MVDWKLGTGESYATLVGFTFPTSEHSDNFSVDKTKLQETTPTHLRDSVQILDKGLQEARISLDGKFFSSTTLRSFQKQLDQTNMFFNSLGWEEKDMYFEQRLYISATRFYIVRTGTVQELREGRRPNSLPYRAVFLMRDQYQYDDVASEDVISGSSGTTSNLDAGGDSFILPYFEFEITSGTLTRLTISCNNSVGTLIIPCNLSTGTTLKINQRTGVAQYFDASGFLLGPAKGIAGRIALRENATNTTFTFSSTGASGNFTAKIRPRYS